MKTLFFSFLFASAVIFAPAADNTSLTGKWQVHNSIAGNESDMNCNLSQKGNDLTGSCGSDQSTDNLTGKVDGKNVSWVFKSKYNGSPITLTYKGALDANNKITGSVMVEEYSVEGEFTATPAK